MRCDEFCIDLPAWREGRLRGRRAEALAAHARRCAACATRLEIERCLIDAGTRLRAEAAPRVDVSARVAIATEAIEMRRRQQRSTRRRAGLVALAALAGAAAATVRLLTLWPQVEGRVGVLAGGPDRWRLFFEPVWTLLDGLLHAAVAVGLGALQVLGRVLEAASEPLAALTLTGVALMVGTIALIVLRDLRTPSFEHTEEKR